MWCNPFSLKRGVLQDCVDEFAQYHGMTYEEALDFLKKTGAYKAIRRNWTYFAHLNGRYLVEDMRKQVIYCGYSCPPIIEPRAV